MFPESSFTYPSGSPVKEPSPSSPNRAYIEKDATFPEPSFNYSLSKFPVNGLPPPRFPNRAPTERDTYFQSLILHIP